MYTVRYIDNGRERKYYSYAATETGAWIEAQTAFPNATILSVTR